VLLKVSSSGAPSTWAGEVWSMRLLLFLVRRNDRGLEARQPRTPQAETGTPERPNGVATGGCAQSAESRATAHRVSLALLRGFPR
jgi:hypothetical protein